MMRDEVRETLDKLDDTIIGEMLIVKDLIKEWEKELCNVVSKFL